MLKQRRWIFLALIAAVCVAGIIILLNWSAIGSSLATPMRKLIGVERVAKLETILFNVQDEFAQLKYRLGLAEPETPWEITQNMSSTATPSNPEEPNPSPTLPAATPTHTPPASSGDSQPTASTAEVVDPTPTTVPTSEAESWTLADIMPFGELPGEGVWQPYITNEQGEVVAYRTFLQPDPERAYSWVAVAAFDLSKTRLHFVLGLEEPAKPGGPHGYGLIPPEDKQPGKLLAAFNGGFIAEHGAYGAMADGITALAGREGLATLAISENGDVRIGKWKIDLPADGKYESWRQNALMIIDQGEINPKVSTGTYIEWGANLDGSVVTIRSSVGLSEDNQVLYYFAGPKLSMPVLADAMAAAGVYNGLLLDINPTHAHFTAMRAQDGALVAEPLFEEEMNIWVDRYLGQWKQDFFYLTTRE